MTDVCVSIILPASVDAALLDPWLGRLTLSLQGLEHEILICAKPGEEPALLDRSGTTPRPQTVTLVHGPASRGAPSGIHAALEASRGDVLVTVPADLSGPPEAVIEMVRKVREEGADLVRGSPSSGGRGSVGDSRLPSVPSRIGEASLRWLSGLGTRDLGGGFRAYRRRFIQSIRIESRSGTELDLELAVKAHLQGVRAAEIPIPVNERSTGGGSPPERIGLPRRLRWTLSALGDPLFVWMVQLAASIAALVFALRNAPVAPFWDEWSNVRVLTGRQPFSLEWLWAQHFEHRIPLAKLLWLGIERVSGGDGRWVVAFLILLLSLSSAILLKGFLKFRGRLLWTDAFIPLLLLHWDHWENMTWPFQIPFSLHALGVSILVASVLGLATARSGRRGEPVDLALLFLPFCGLSTLPFLFLMVPWRLYVILRKGPERRSWGSAVWPCLALVLAGALLVHYRRISDGPPSPNLRTSLNVALEFLTGSLGHKGSRSWPESGGWALGLLGPTLFVLLWNSRRSRARPAVAQGLALVLLGVIGLATMVGNSRGGMSAFAGFFDRYVTLSCTFPLVVYAGGEFWWPGGARRALQILLAALMLFLYLPNAEHAWDLLGQRRRANDSLVRDVQAGMPIPILASVHSDWHMGTPDELEDLLRGLARLQYPPFRACPPSHLPPLDVADLETAGRVHLRDERVLLALESGGSGWVELGPGGYELQLTPGLLRGAPALGGIAVRVSLEGSASPILWTGAVALLQPVRFPARLTARARLRIELRVASNQLPPEGRRFWIMVEASPRTEPTSP